MPRMVQAETSLHQLVSKGQNLGSGEGDIAHPEKMKGLRYIRLWSERMVKQDAAVCFAIRDRRMQSPNGHSIQWKIS